jgi:hypothetical protein
MPPGTFSTIVHLDSKNTLEPMRMPLKPQPTSTN